MTPIAPEMAHDLRLCLQQITSCAQLLKLELSDGPAADYAELLMDGARRMEALLSAGLAPEAAPPRLARLELSGALRELCRRCQPWARQRGVALAYAANAAALTVVTDEDRLSRALLNLISNALRFTPPGGRVTLRLTALGDWVEIAVRDTGDGIAPERLPRVFLEGETTGGHGKGLPIAQRLARELGGCLRAESVSGKGSRFTLRLPVTPIHHQPSEVS